MQATNLKMTMAKKQREDTVNMSGSTQNTHEQEY